MYVYLLCVVLLYIVTMMAVVCYMRVLRDEAITKLYKAE